MQPVSRINLKLSEFLKVWVGDVAQLVTHDLVHWPAPHERAHLKFQHPGYGDKTGSF